MTRDDLPSDEAIAMALQLSGYDPILLWTVEEIKAEWWDEASTAQAILAFARYIQENPRND